MGAITTFLDIPVTVSPHKSLNRSKGVIRNRDLRCCLEEEMVEELSGVTHVRRIKVRRGEDKIQTDTVVLTFDSLKPPSRIRAGYLTLDVRLYVPMRCYKCQGYGHGKDRCKEPAAVCVRCAKGGHVERDCSADPYCVNRRGDHAAAARPVRSSWKNKPFFVTKLRMAVRFSKPVRQLWLKSIKRFQPVLMLVPSRPSFERSQQRFPRMAAEVPLLPRPRGKKPRRILRLPVPREQQKQKYQPSAGPKSRKVRRPLGKQSIVLRLWPWSNFEALKLLLNRSQSAFVALQECRLGEGQLSPRGYTLLLPQVSKLSLAELFGQLPKPLLVLGDFNVHSATWGDSRRDGQGRMLEEFTAENDFIILNSGEQTFVHSVYHSTSAIDLAVASPSIAAECSWAVHSDLCGSYHFPIFLTLSSHFKYDFAIYAEGKHLQHLERTIQLCINIVQKWVSENGFRFSVSKTTCVHFHRQRIYTEPALYLDGQPIPVKGTQGNENVDKLAKAALNKPSYSGKLICWSDLKPKVNAYTHTVWQKDWDTEGANKLHEVLLDLGEDLHKKGEGAGRKRETVMCRLRVGHTLLTQNYLLKNEEQPFCYTCNSLYTVRHILIECPDFQLTRRKYFSVTDLYRLFREGKAFRIMGYLKELGVYGNI
ncbi:RNA-directed DNA polymerase from mobile element jockey [Plakobranchus ocellatus]|uniref:RNA-directed DNA polymerase from mobile element jockey n=1 Tax=Plakobranchus ocellatus TaxID=259542 RepID=A0AAV3YJA8_9GAST|nr:RNA-directed DNA polymerase from mobile element jockey [Plakobranchus ocellatus]